MPDGHRAGLVWAWAFQMGFTYAKYPGFPKNTRFLRYLGLYPSAGPHVSIFVLVKHARSIFRNFMKIKKIKEIGSKVLEIVTHKVLKVGPLGCLFKKSLAKIQLHCIWASHSTLDLKAAASQFTLVAQIVV